MIVINYFMYLVGFALMMILDVKCFSLYHCTRKRAVWYTLLTYPCGVGSAMLMGMIYTAMTTARGVPDKSKVAIFGALMFTPLLLLLAVFIERTVIRIKDKEVKQKTLPGYRDTIDMLTPGIFIILTCAKFGCFLGGCCRGISCDFGFYSHKIEARVFPVQICEFITMCGVLLLSYYLKHKPFYRRGMAYPLTAAIYTVGRFGWEYLRYYPEGLRPYAFGMTYWQIFCIFVFIASVISILVLYKKYQPEPLKKLKKPVVR